MNAVRKFRDSLGKQGQEELQKGEANYQNLSMESQD